MNECKIVYTPWENLKKTSDMVVGQVGYHNSKRYIIYRIYSSESCHITHNGLTIDQITTGVSRNMTPTMMRNSKLVVPGTNILQYSKNAKIFSE